MLLIIEKVIILKSIKIFSEISENDLLSLSSHLKEVEFETGHEVIKQGDMGTSMYIIAKGSVDVMINDNFITSLGEKEVFGELAALDPEPRSATVCTKEKTLLFKIENTVVYDLILEYPNAAKAIISILCQRIRAK